LSDKEFIEVEADELNKITEKLQIVNPQSSYEKYIIIEQLTCSTAERLCEIDSKIRKVEEEQKKYQERARKAKLALAERAREKRKNKEKKDAERLLAVAKDLSIPLSEEAIKELEKKIKKT
jgi:hypothetical protein